MSFAVLAVLALVAGACGSAGTSRAFASPPASRAPASAGRTANPSTQPGSATPSPTSTDSTFDLLPPSAPVSAASAARLAGITCAGSIGPSDPVAVVTLHDGSYVLRDYADISNPRTACTFATPPFEIQLIDAHHVVLPGDGLNLYAVVDLPDVRFRWFQLPPGGYPTFLAVSPGLDAVAWLSANLTNNTDEVHLTTRSGDSVVASLPNPHSGRCGSPEDSGLAAYTHSGNHLFVLDQPVPSLNSLAVIEGSQTRLLLEPPGGQWANGGWPAMALWSPTSETLYYRLAGDVWKWTPGGGPQKFLPGVKWYYPTISPDGAHLAYAVLRTDGLHNVYLVDLAHGGGPQLIGRGARNLPTFLNSTQLWFKSEAQGICGPGGDQPLIYDLTDSSETSSIIDSVMATWPATAWFI